MIARRTQQSQSCKARASDVGSTQNSPRASYRYRYPVHYNPRRQESTACITDGMREESQSCRSEHTYMIPPALIEIREVEGQTVLDELEQNARDMGHHPVAVYETLHH